MLQLSLKIILLMSLSYGLCSCTTGRIPYAGNSESQEIENLHIDDKISYPESPFDPLVKESFKNNIHYCTLLDIGDDALLFRVHLARTAKKSINIQTYIWSDDESGRLMVYELVRAAKRGVKVKIIIDQLSHNRDPAMVAFLSTVSPNLELKFYNPNVKKVNPDKFHYLKAAFRFKQINQRMHNKIFVVDDRIGITGGRNYQNDYFDRGKSRNFKDRDVVVVGPAVKKMTDSFMDYWAYELSISSLDMIDVKTHIDKKLYPKWDKRDDYQLDNLFVQLEKNVESRDYVKKLIDKYTHKIKKVDFIADFPGKNEKRSLRGRGIIIEDIVRLLSKAQNQIIIQTPYLVLDRDSRLFFRKIRREKPGLDILISSNSLAAADHFTAYAFSYKYKKYYVKNLKWRIFEFKFNPLDLDQMIPPIEGIERGKGYFTCIHSKTFIVDNDKTYIGSFNLDPRSIHLNTEVGVIIYDHDFTQTVRKNIARDMAPGNSWAIARRKKVPLLSQLSGIMDDLSKLIPIIDIWPFSYTASYKLAEDGREMPHFHKNFYKNYISVGPFPDVALTQKEIKARLIKSFFGPLEPLI